jgi:hypothetical protein
MPQSRKTQVSLIDTPYYHCVSRCVCRSFLCGTDKYTEQSYEHRRAWVEERLLFLSSVFSIGICAYAVMSNHTHVVLCVDKDMADGWTMQEVARINRTAMFTSSNFLLLIMMAVLLIWSC